MKKKVTFNEDNNKILVMYTWSHAYREARKGHWQQYTIDAKRFERKIKNVYEPVLSRILDGNHRENFYNKYVCD